MSQSYIGYDSQKSYTGHQTRVKRIGTELRVMDKKAENQFTNFYK